MITYPCLLTTNVDRTRDPPWGVQGGQAGQPGCVTVYKEAGGSEIISKVRNYPLKAGDVVVLETGGGGGWGPPAERARKAIERDIARRLYHAGRGRARLRYEAVAPALI